MKRRDFIKKATFGTAAVTILPQLITCGKSTKTDSKTIRDRLWMWGHEFASIANTPNLPKGGNIGMVEAIQWIGIPNVCVINHGDVIELPYEDAYIKQFKDVKRVAWSIMSGPEWSPQYDKVRKYNYNELAEGGFSLLDKMPNLAEFYLDDFFAGNVINESTGLSESYMSLERLKALKNDIRTLKRQPQLTAVLYTNQLSTGIKEHISYFDRVSLWTWQANDLSILEDNFRKYREFIPDKPTLLGIYMWDFGNLTTISLEQMKRQLDFAHELLITGAVEGLIFHCTPLCDMDLEAVHYSRKWIEEHGDEKIEST